MLLRFIKLCATQNARKPFYNRFFTFAASIFQIFGVENARIFRAKFADRARSALRMPTNRILKLRSSSARRALPSKPRENIFKPKFRVCGVDFLNFRRRKRRNFSRKNLQIARVRRCARPSIAFAQSPAVCCFLKCARTCLQPIFQIYGVDFSNFWRRKRCNFPRKIRRSGAFGVAHGQTSHY